MAKVELKAPVVQEIAAKIDGAQSAVLVDHRGMTVAQDTELRKRLREAGVEYKVYKNTQILLLLMNISRVPALWLFPRKTPPRPQGFCMNSPRKQNSLRSRPVLLKARLITMTS